MSRTDKTDPYRVKVDRYGPREDRQWAPIYRCGCWLCSPDGPTSKQVRADGRKAARDWQRDY